jgi:hypothetical protein
MKPIALLMKHSLQPRLLASAALTCMALSTLPACVPLVVGGAVVGGGLVATDRRTSPTAFAKR